MLFEFVDYVRSRWRLPVIAAVSAVLAAAAAGWLLPSRYTAMASILIDAPGGVDPRAATAVSPVYLESLRTYEHLASSDSLFAEAIARLHVREQYSGVPLESLKSRVLKVRKPRDTKILEISITLSDPKKAQALAQYIAEKTVSLSRSLDQSSDVAEEMRAHVDAAKARLAAARGDLAELLTEEQATGNHERVRSRIAGLRGRIAELEWQDATAARLNEVNAGAGLRSERLKIIDPGIVPERPSFPNRPLLVIAALFISTVLSLVYLALAFQFGRPWMRERSLTYR